ncbi:MAG: hypothetical protein ABI622_07985 [Chloroflexota bacterium]
MPKQTPPTHDDPDKLLRQAAGTYRSADERFEVRQTDQGWYLVDAEQTDDFGQELVRGPFATLAAVRTAIPPARSSKVVPLPRRVAAPPKAGAGRTSKARPRPIAPPPTWIDRLPAAEATEVRRLVRGLEAEGIEKAEQLVRRDRDGLLPAVVTQLIQRRLGAILEGAGPPERELVARVVALLTADGVAPRDALPGWMLVEIGPEPVPPNRRIGL